MSSDHGRLAPMGGTGRAKRFWTAHGRSRAHLVVLYAFSSNPTMTWTVEGLVIWYGIPKDCVSFIVDELARAGVIVVAREPWSGFRWNPRHDWAAPRRTELVRFVSARFAAMGA